VQPVPYSHKLHAGEMLIDCRYCHASVETSPIANVPPTQACMICHLLVSRNVESLAPIRDSAKSGTPMRWKPARDPEARARQIAALRPVKPPVDCSGCHR